MNEPRVGGKVLSIGAHISTNQMFPFKLLTNQKFPFKLLTNQKFLSKQLTNRKLLAPNNTFAHKTRPGS